MYFLKTIRTSNKLGAINLPKKSRTAMGFEPGTLVEIHLQGKEIWIYRSRHNEKENHRYISSKGTVTIPAEFRHILDINKNTVMQLYIDEEKRAFILK